MKNNARIAARLVPHTWYDRERSQAARYIARCGRCGQSLWVVEASDGLHPAHLKDLDKGWRFDPEERAWHPTTHHLAQRRAARERVRTGTGDDRDRVSLRIAGSGFGRDGRPSGDGQSAYEGPTSAAERRAEFLRRPDRWNKEVISDFVARSTPRFGDTASLPVNVACPQCGRMNELADPALSEGD